MSGENDIARLPPIVQVIARACGLDAALRFVQEFGGRRLYVPANPTPGQPIHDRAGPEVARLLAALKGAESIDVPQAAALRSPSAAQRQAILAHPGSHSEAAHELGVSRSWVQKVRAAGTEAAAAPRRVGGRRRPRDDQTLDLEDWMAAKKAG